MDEEELEQPRKKITISNFFESIESIDKVANRALKKTESNLGIISENKLLIEALSKSFDNIITEVREIKEYIMIKDEDKDKLFSQEDQEQKIKRLERLQGLGDKPSKDDKDFKKQAAETVKKALQDPNIMQIFTGLIGLSVSGLLGLGAVVKVRVFKLFKNELINSMVDENMALKSFSKENYKDEAANNIINEAPLKLEENVNQDQNSHIPENSNGLENFELNDETPQLFNVENDIESEQINDIAKVDNEEDDLEIPPFLRRQKN